MADIYWTTAPTYVDTDRWLLSDLKNLARNFEYLKNPSYAIEPIYYTSPGVSTYETVSIATTTWTEIHTNYWQAVVETRASSILLFVQIQFSMSASAVVGYIDIEVDDSYFLGGEDGLITLPTDSILLGQRKELWLLIDGLTPGQHKFDLWFKRTGSGTFSVLANNNFIYAVEIL